MGKDAEEEDESVTHTLSKVACELAVLAEHVREQGLAFEVSRSNLVTHAQVFSILGERHHYWVTLIVLEHTMVGVVQNGYTQTVI